MPTIKRKTDNKVYIEKSHTKRLGEDYVKITVGITLHVNPTKEDLEEVKQTIEIANELVDTEMEDHIKTLMS